MKVTVLADNLYLVRCRSQEELARTFVRFQEYLESPRFRHHYFSIAQYKRWFTLNVPEGRKAHRFTFYQDIAGFNIPGHVLKPFLKGKFNPLSAQETALLEAFRNVKGRYYIIGVYGKPTSVLRHEKAHALYYLSKAYRTAVLQYLHILPRAFIKAYFDYFTKTKLYHPAVFYDELQAYCLSPDIIPDDLDSELRKKATTQLLNIYHYYAPQIITK